MTLNEITEAQDSLLKNSRALAGYTLGELAETLQLKVPANLKKKKGWVGMLIETALGATAGSKPQQDFPELGIELKTIPLSYDNTPLETTYVCYAPLLGNHKVTWETSNVRNKLQKVLWLPIQGEREIPVSDRLIGHAILWHPSIEQNQRMKQDWEELMDMICLGRVEEITAGIGEVMQLRPKAANGQALTSAIGEEGNIIKTRPRGFYLRKSFTAEILNIR
ncbi:MAG: DNA mismatch repair endonuclease MutH [Pseudomonadota bacterium]